MQMAMEHELEAPDVVCLSLVTNFLLSNKI